MVDVWKLLIHFKKNLYGVNNYVLKGIFTSQTCFLKINFLVISLHFFCFIYITIHFGNVLVGVIFGLVHIPKPLLVYCCFRKCWWIMTSNAQGGSRFILWWYLMCFSSGSKSCLLSLWFLLLILLVHTIWLKLMPDDTGNLCP